MDEIYRRSGADQPAVRAGSTKKKKLSNIVFMGMGEPLLNYKKRPKRPSKRITAPDGPGHEPPAASPSPPPVSAKMIRQLGRPTK